MRNILRVLFTSPLIGMMMMSCTENNLPTPFIPVKAGEFQVGLPSESFIRRKLSGDTIHLYVADNIDLRKVEIQQLKIDSKPVDVAVAVLDSARCADYKK
ncbi:MAG: hypothetical protein HUK03_00435, partial [Bacteroidaceae bacterium]|nr:hypothetical protein [Bacteroidaceae bacterium]